MEKKILSRKEFNAAAKVAEKELRDNVKNNIFHTLNELNKSARKNEYCDKELIKPVADIVRKRHEGRYPFSLDLFTKDVFGRFCTCRKYTGEVSAFDIDEIEHGQVVLSPKGHEMRLSADNEYIVYLKPVSCDIVGMFRDFKYIISAELGAAEKAQKQAAKDMKRAEQEAKKAEKRREQVVKELSLKMLRGEITREEFYRKVEAA